MKAISIVMAFICLGASAAYAQKINADQVPTNIQSAFNKQFTKPYKIQWEMEEADFEVNFKNKNVEYSAKYDKQGKWLETEKEVKKSELPIIIQQALEKEFPKAEIEESEKITYLTHGVVYELEIEKDKQKLEVQFSAEGNLLKKEKKD